ncbi:MAG: ABC transporter substrate-binding protein [Chloroflexi bacterium]|nr:ABC transporter substrate-binding protein [Chloroflexota bacterium]
MHTDLWPSMPDTRLTRRSALGLFISSASVITLAACQASAPTQSSATPPPAAPTTPVAAVGSTPDTGRPKQGGTLRIGIPNDIPNLDPNYSSPYGFDTVWQIYDRLTQYDDQLQPQPRLAESWEVSSDYKQVKLNLRKGLTFHNGKPFTSDDVKWTIMRVRDPGVGGGAGLTPQSNWWTGIDTPDKNTIVLTSDQPRPAMFDFFEYLNIGDQQTLEPQGAQAKTSTNGLGPFSLQEWAQGDHIGMVKNQSYWHSGLPYLDGITFSVLKDVQGMTAQLEAGAQDLVLNTTTQDFVRLKGNPSYVAGTNPISGQYYCVGFNTGNHPFDNKLVRQAINYAINRQRFTETVLQGIQQPKSLVWAPASQAYDEARVNYFGFDLDKARSLLAQAGVSNLSMELIVSNAYPGHPEFAQILQSDLQTIGVTLSINQTDAAGMLAALNAKPPTYKGMYVFSSGRSQLYPGTTLSVTAPFAPASNIEGFSDPAYSQLVEQINAEADATKRKQELKQVNDLLLDQAFTSAISSADNNWVSTNHVHGIVNTAHIGLDYSGVWLG